MSRRNRAHELPMIVATATLLWLSACSVGPPTLAQCIARWNHPGNREAQETIAEIRHPRASVAGWPTKAGDHCSVTFFTRPGDPWVMFVLWLDDPEPTARFEMDIAGSRYGRGELGAERPIPPNAEVEEDGTLSEHWVGSTVGLPCIPRPLGTGRPSFAPGCFPS